MSELSDVKPTRGMPQMFRYTYLFNGFTPDRVLRPRGRISQRVVRGLFMQHLPTLKPTMLQKIDEAFHSEISDRLTGQGLDITLLHAIRAEYYFIGWVDVPIVAMCRKVVVELTSFHVLGEALSAYLP